MRTLLIDKIYELEQVTGIECCQDLQQWSNEELLVYYGNLRVEEHFKFIWDTDNFDETTGDGGSD